ncbi:MAG: chromosomal replication initiator protein DnaA [Gracilibacteraceae bacterium]|jgi:chromosomal replication initiator protein|nr:chromosomal replication initiator protein DnaA [Gracilibacteraceae bacterium]
MTVEAEQLDEFWSGVLAKIRAQISLASYEQWFLATKLVSFENNSLEISVPDKFIKDWLESRFYNLIKHIVQNETQSTVSISFIEEGHFSGGSSVSLSGPLNPRYTFQSFVIGDGNRFAHAAALAVAEFPAKSYNPLFIYGGSGLGKTHLMHAIGHQISHTMPSFKIIYVTGEQFTNELIDSIRYEKQAEFRDTYRKVDMLLIDDIQFLANKEGTQMEFFYTFNALHEANKQIIISSDRPPRDIPTLQERLRSRFEGGLTTDINPPDYETRMAILRTKIQNDNIPIPDEVLDFIASSIQSNVRELEGALSKFTAYCKFTSRQPTEELAREILKDLMPQSRKITTETIMKTVANRYRITTDDLKQNKRSQLIALPRQISMYLCRELTELSLPQIGDAFGGRDHSTVIHAINRIRERKKLDVMLEKTLLELITDIKSK